MQFCNGRGVSSAAFQKATAASCQSAVACSRAVSSAMASAIVARVTIGGHSCMVWPQQRVGRALSEFSQFQYSRFKKDAGDLQRETFVHMCLKDSKQRLAEKKHLHKLL